MAGRSPEARIPIVCHADQAAKFGGPLREAHDLGAFARLRNCDEQRFRAVEGIETKEKFRRLHPVREKPAAAERPMERIRRMQRTAHAREQDAPELTRAQICPQRAVEMRSGEFFSDAAENVRLSEDVSHIAAFDELGVHSKSNDFIAKADWRIRLPDRQSTGSYFGSIL